MVFEENAEACYDYFLKESKKLNRLLDSSHLAPKEVLYRKSELEHDLEKINTSVVTGRIDFDCHTFYEHAHEIRSISFLSKYGNLKTAQDYCHEKGTDFVLDGKVYIESVCSSLGEQVVNGKKNPILTYLPLHGEALIDYDKPEDLLKARLTSSLKEKRDFYLKHSALIPSDKPYVIFLSLGRLSYEWFAGCYGQNLLSILIGMGNPTILIDEATGKQLYSGFSYKKTFTKYNGSTVPSNLFFSEENDYACVSAVMLTTELNHQYSSKNTFLFLNPNATNKLNPNTFANLIYWNQTDEGFAPFLKGNRKNIKGKLL